MSYGIDVHTGWRILRKYATPESLLKVRVMALIAVGVLLLIAYALFQIRAAVK